MKRETKYYIPHTDEFCLGFEYEELDMEFLGKKTQKREEFIFGSTEIEPITNRYQKKVFENTIDNNLERIERQVSNLKIRVKFLDANDVISCGFEFVGESKEYQLFRKVVRAGTNPSIVELSLSYCGDFPVVSISEEEDILLNRIICLNKNELKWLLTRLKIA